MLISSPHSAQTATVIAKMYSLSFIVFTMSFFCKRYSVSFLHSIQKSHLSFSFIMVTSDLPPDYLK